MRTERLDLSGQITDLLARAGGLAHPALEAAAVEHADYLAQLGEQTDLLRRQVLLVLREPIDPAAAAPTDGLGGPSAAGGADRASAWHTAHELLTPAGIVVTPLDAGQATSVLASACNPDMFLPPSAGLAGADEIITSPGGQQIDPCSDGWSSGDEGLPDGGLGEHDPDDDIDDGDDWASEDNDDDDIEDDRRRW